MRFPISIQISEYDKEFHELYLRRGHPDELQFCKFMYMGKIWVFSNISGLISVFPNGSIHSCNDNFSRMFFGYSDSELLGKVGKYSFSVDFTSFRLRSMSRSNWWSYFLLHNVYTSTTQFTFIFIMVLK